MKRLLGQGATGEVYLAQDVALGRRVALKLIRRELMGQQGAERFLEEARTTARFNHPHIVTLHTLGEYEGRPFLALEYIDGESLRVRLEAGPLAPREAMRVARAVAEAVAESHHHDVIHADLKPENVMMGRDGRVRVVDFGLAQFMGAASGMAFGTRAYMAPELWRGATPTSAIDVWALGIMLYELIDGARPFSAADFAQLAYRDDPFTLPAGRREEPWALVVRACLARDPRARPSADEVEQSLTRLLDGAPAAPQEDRCPFPGLASFERAHACDYFGREAELEALVEKLRSQALVPVAGSSGIGKSSLIEAALVPRLEEGGRWIVARCRPGASPLESLARALGSPEPASDAGAWRTHPAKLALSIERLTRTERARVLLVIDQFEEAFTLAPADEARSFCECVAAAALADESWRIVLTIRDDFLGRLAESTGMREHLGALLMLAPMGRADLEAAVRGPLRRAGYDTDEPDLAGRIAADVEARPAGLALLQFACAALWTRRDVEARTLLAAEYEAIGRASGALAKHAERLLARLPPAHVEVVRAALLRLVNSDGTRRPRLRREALDGLAAGAAEVVERLLAHRLLVAYRRADDGEPMLEIAHEALAAAWPRFAQWLDETYEERLLRSEIEQAAAVWRRRGRRDDETWAGDALAQAERRVAQWRIELTAEGREFLDTGVRRRLRARRRRARSRTVVGALLALAACASTAAAVVFQRKEREAINQQEQIRLASGDMGLFELELAPFDWDDATLTPRPAATAPPLDWALYAVESDPHAPGRPYGPSDLRRGTSRVERGVRRELVEARSGPAFLEVRERGGACAPTRLRLQRLPGYAERQPASPVVVRVPVPTCQATHAGTVPIPAGEFFRNVDQTDDGQGFRDELMSLPAFAIDRTEVTRAAFAQYEALEALTKDLFVTAEHLQANHADPGRLPAVGVNYFTAQNYCRFLGKELPSVEQWQKAFRGGVMLADGPNPAPTRLAIWGAAAPRHPTNLEGAGDGFDELAPVRSFSDDVSPYGVFDLAGNASEWSTGRAGPNRLRGLRVVLGGNWGAPPALELHLIKRRNTRHDLSFDFAVGFRCVTP
ncbi:MAG: protein kinase [Polyangiaceae bacterium]|nr:protein kinase [Polyangiaceae bacterium]